MDNTITFSDLHKLNAKKLNEQLIHSARQGNFQEVFQCIELGASVYATNKNGLTPLMAAAKNGHAEIIQFLLQFKPEIEAVFFEPYYLKQKTAIICAAEFGIRTKNTDALNVLLKAGAFLDLTYFRGSSWGSTFSEPLIWAASHGLTETVSYFLSHSQEMNPIETIDMNTGYTPLTFAVIEGHVATAKLLIELGANLDVTDSKNQTLPFITMKKKNSKMLQLLLKTNHYDVNTLTYEQMSLWEYAVRHQLSLDIHKVLIHAGVNINEVTTHYTRTALNQASKYGFFDLVDFLLTSGADMTITDSNGKTAFQLAFGCCFYGEKRFSGQSERNIAFRFLSCMPVKMVNSIGDTEEYSELIVDFKNEMKAIRTRQLAAFGLAEIKSLTDNLIEFGYELLASAKAVFVTPEAPLPYLPKEMVALVISEPCLYPCWYAHRIQHDIDFILQTFINATPKYVTPNLIKENINRPQAVIFSNPNTKRKATDNLDDTERNPKKMKKEDPDNKNVLNAHSSKK